MQSLHLPEPSVHLGMERLIRCCARWQKHAHLGLKTLTVSEVVEKPLHFVSIRELIEQLPHCQFRSFHLAAHVLWMGSSESCQGFDKLNPGWPGDQFFGSSQHLACPDFAEGSFLDI